MANHFKISIPKPCNESWDKMTPNEKGRFCSSCSKTVIDFTGKTRSEIKQELQARKNEKLCGHFYKKQLDGLVIQIPEETFQKQLSYSKLFLLVLLLTMGTTLISCTSQNGEKQKIENVVVEKKKCGTQDLSKNALNGNEYIEGEVSLPPVDEVMGLIIASPDEKIKDLFTIQELDEYPRFKNAEFTNKEAAKKDFEKNISTFFKNEFDYDTKENKYGLEGIQRIYVYFEINEKGVVENIKARAKNNDLKIYIIEITKKLPQFEPGVRNGKPVSVSYTLPIVYRIN